MKHLGFLLFLGGLTVASWYASKVVPVPEGEPAGPVERLVVWGKDAGGLFGVGLAAMVVGGLLARRARHASAAVAKKAGEGKHEEDGVGVLGLLDHIDEKLAPMEAGALPEGAQALADTLDELLTDTVPDFLDHREELIEKLGLETFAELIGQFASMERGAARAWSAITDEAWGEVGPSLDKAKSSLAAARDIARAKLEA